jgi:dihydrofolate reductase
VAFWGMGQLRYSINVTLDGCYDHRVMASDAELHRHAAESLRQADALLFGRVTYQLMEDGWRRLAETGERPDWAEEWTVPFAAHMHAARKLVVSRTLAAVDWNGAELMPTGDLKSMVEALKRQSPRGVFTGGVALPRTLAELGLIDEYEFVVHPRVVGHGPALFAGLPSHLDLKLVDRREFGSGAVALRYVPKG